MEKFLSKLEGPTVLVKVGTGDSSREFTVSRSLLSLCTWFRAALEDDRFQEGRTGVISLPEDTLRAFRSFYFYLLRRKLIFKYLYLKSETFDEFVEQLNTSIEIWIFAGKYSSRYLRDCAMEAFCWHLDSATPNDIGLPPASLAVCFSHTAEDSPLRKLAADYVVTRMHGGKADAGELVGELAPLRGFIQALNEAHQFHHDAKKGTSIYI
ncbi:hypothetical protein CBER1_07045 [Cercospora berteroae]|uniref:BTB domain-containing protein n=1 Tax=Cercospora berteroae TaxID=357750 RepID=A0A2S6C6Z5_9PEZI|nr:hypothetical protein CBER1_07045 [Cercospora berteroae]